MVWPSLDVPTSRGIGLPGRRQTVASGTIRLFMHITMSPCRRRGRVGEWEKDMKRRWYVATNEGGKKGGAFMISSRTPWHPVKAGRPATLSDGAHGVHRFDWWWSPQLQGYSTRCHRRMPRDHERDRATTTGTYSTRSHQWMPRGRERDRATTTSRGATMGSLGPERGEYSEPTMGRILLGLQWESPQILLGKLKKNHVYKLLNVFFIF